MDIEEGYHVEGEIFVNEPTERPECTLRDAICLGEIWDYGEIISKPREEYAGVAYSKLALPSHRLLWLDTGHCRKVGYQPRRV
jgi:hypothetical protein